LKTMNARSRNVVAQVSWPGLLGPRRPVRKTKRGRRPEDYRCLVVGRCWRTWPCWRITGCGCPDRRPNSTS
jgi:hypothetical protein